MGHVMDCLFHRTEAVVDSLGELGSTTLHSKTVHWFDDRNKCHPEKETHVVEEAPEDSDKPKRFHRFFFNRYDCGELLQFDVHQ